MAEIFGFNQDRGTWYEVEEDPQTGDQIIHSKSICDPVLEQTRMDRNSGKGDRGVKGEFWHYATIPVGVELELRGKGLNIYDKNNTKQLLKEINQNYPHLKNTNLTHNIK